MTYENKPRRNARGTGEQITPKANKTRLNSNLDGNCSRTSRCHLIIQPTPT